MGKRANPLAVKASLTYEVGEAAAVLGKSPATIRNWIKDGLPVMSSKKPNLILGAQIRDYLRAKYKATKSPLAPDELNCFSCRAGRKPSGMTVTAVPNNTKTINLMGQCSHCGGKAGRLIAISKTDAFAQIFDIKKGGSSEAYEIPQSPA